MDFRGRAAALWERPWLAEAQTFDPQAFLWLDILRASDSCFRAGVRNVETWRQTAASHAQPARPHATSRRERVLTFRSPHRAGSTLW